MEFALIFIVIAGFDLLVFQALKKLYFISIINILLVTLYLVIPYILFRNDYEFALLYPEASTPPDVGYFITIIVAYLSINISFYLSLFAKNSRMPVGKQNKFQFSNKMYWFILILTFIFYSLYISKVGFINSLSSGFGIRSGEIDLGAEGVAIRMLPITSTFMLFLLFDRIILKNTSRKSLTIIYVTIFFLWSLTTAGRGALLTPIAILVTSYFLYIRTHKIPITRKKVVNLSLALVSIVLFIVYGKAIFTVLPYIIQMNYRDVVSNFEEYRALNALSDNSLFMTLSKEYLHPYFTLDSLFKEKFDFIYFRDILDAIIDFIPEKIFSIGVDMHPSVSRINTIRLFGIDEASYPPGYLGFSYYSLGLSGIIIGSFFLGYIIAKINLFYIRYRLNNPYVIIWISILLFTAVTFFTNGDVRVFSRDNFLSILIVYILYKIDKIKFA